MVSNPGHCIQTTLQPHQTELELHSYLDDSRSGLDSLQVSSTYNIEQQVCPYSGANTEYQFGDACVYLS